MTISTKQVTRGNQIRIRARFTDFDRKPVTPNTAFVVINYSSNGVANTTTLTMNFESGNNVFSAFWDTTGKDTGVVKYHVYENSAGEAAEDGEIVIVSGASNFGV